MFGRRRRQPKPDRIYYIPRERTHPHSVEEALVLAEKMREQAARRRDEVRAQLLDQVERGIRDFGVTPISVVVDFHLRTDPIWKPTTADEQWYRDWAQTYGARERQQQPTPVITQRVGE